MNKMIEKIKGFSDEKIISIWESLRNYNPSDIWEGEITMETWAEHIYIEKSIRGL